MITKKGYLAVNLYGIFGNDIIKKIDRKIVEIRQHEKPCNGDVIIKELQMNISTFKNYFNPNNIVTLDFDHLYWGGIKIKITDIFGTDMVNIMYIVEDYCDDYKPYNILTIPGPNKENWIKRHISFIGRNSIYGIPTDLRLKIKQVIYNKPATIIFWMDGTKTVVKCKEDEAYDKEKGFAMAFMKKALGNEGNYYETVKKWVPYCKEAEDDAADMVDKEIEKEVKKKSKRK